MKRYLTLLLILLINAGMYAQCLNVSTSILNVNCNGGSDGGINFIPNNGQSPYTYDWGTGSTTVATSYTMTGLSANFYTVTVTDNLGCDTIMGFSVSEP